MDDDGPMNSIVVGGGGMVAVAAADNEQQYGCGWCHSCDWHHHDD